MCDAGPQPDYYVNGPPEGSSRDKYRCQYQFTKNSKEPWHQVKCKHCGLRAEREQRRCVLHSDPARKAGEGLKQRLEHQAKPKNSPGHGPQLYLGEAKLAGLDLTGVQLPKVTMPFAELQDTILKDADLVGATLHRSDLQGADLTEANLQDANLSRAELCGADLHGARLHGANLQYISENEQNAYINLRWTFFGELSDGRAAKLERANLARALLSGARVAPTITLSNVVWAKKYHLWDEECARDEEKWKDTKNRVKGAGERPTFAECANIYHELRVACQRSALQEAESAFFVREMECKRARMDRDLFGGRQIRRWLYTLWWLLSLLLAVIWVPLLAIPALLGCSRVAARQFASFGWLLMYYLAGYTEWPGRVIAWAAGIWALSAGILCWNGCANGAGLRLRDAMYASTVNLTSLNVFGTDCFGPEFRAGGVFNTVASIESVCGIVLAALFVACLVRKFSR